jgi:hypothetical protein
MKENRPGSSKWEGCVVLRKRGLRDSLTRKTKGPKEASGETMEQNRKSGNIGGTSIASQAL